MRRRWLWLPSLPCAAARKTIRAKKRTPRKPPVRLTPLQAAGSIGILICFRSLTFSLSTEFLYAKSENLDEKVPEPQKAVVDHAPTFTMKTPCKVRVVRLRCPSICVLDARGRQASAEGCLRLSLALRKTAAPRHASSATCSGGGTKQGGVWQ